jgi:glycosyltransferase 2 family protein
MSVSPISRKRRLPVLRVLGTLVAMALLGYLLWQQGWQEIAAAVRQITPLRFALACMLTIASRLFVSGRWHILLRSAGVNISAAQTARLTFGGLFASNFLPTTVGGDVARLGGGLRLNYNQSVLIASLIVDRLVGMAGMALALPFGLPALLNSTALTTAWIGSPAGGLAGTVAFKNAHLKGLLLKGEGALRRMLQALGLWLSRPLPLLLSLAFTWGHMLCLFASLWLLLDSMGQPVPFWLIGGLWSISYFITLLPVSINGLGWQEGSLYFLFFVVAGVSDPVSLTLPLLIRILQMFASLPGAFFIPEMVAGREAPNL